MRIVAFAILSACALAACNPSTGSGSDGSAAGGDGGFPSLDGASYRAVATVTNDEGETMPIVTIRDGQNLRMEFSGDGGNVAIITKPASGESYVLTTQGGRTMAIRASGMAQRFENPAESWSGDLASTATRTGECSVAGESGNEWTKTTAEDGTDTACVTDDGIILRATDDGRTVWETTQVDRGPQQAALFELPPGVQVMDVGDVGGMMQQIERAKRGQ